MTSSMTACSRRSSGERWTTWGRSGPGGRHKTDLGFLRIKSVRMEHLTASMAGTSSTFNRIMLKSDLSRDIGYLLLRQQINKKYSPQHCVKNMDFPPLCIKRVRSFYRTTLETNGSPVWGVKKTLQNRICPTGKIGKQMSYGMGQLLVEHAKSTLLSYSSNESLRCIKSNLWNPNPLQLYSCILVNPAWRGRCQLTSCLHHWWSQYDSVASLLWQFMFASWRHVSDIDGCVLLKLHSV